MALDYLLCGWRVRADMVLPELPPWRGDDRTPEVIIRLGDTPDRLDGSVALSPFLTIAGDGRCLFSIEAVGDFLVEGGTNVVLRPRGDPGSTETRLFLLGTVLGLLCHQRGLFPLHASCVRRDGRAYAFAGPSGAGKSTLAATLARSGDALLSDDVCVIDPGAAGGPAVLPAFPRVKLWRDSLDRFGVPADSLERNRPDQEKYHWRLPVLDDQGAVPLAAVYLLDRAGPETPAGLSDIESLPARAAALTSHVFRRQAGEALGRRESLFADAVRVAAAVPVRRLIRDLNGADAWRVPAALEVAWAS